MSDDIVARLRDWASHICTVNTSVIPGSKARMAREAADEIERLREELTASHESHGNEVGALTERLSLAIHERDEARRRVCEDAVHMGDVYRRVNGLNVQLATGREVADMMGWDCFKEETTDER